MAGADLRASSSTDRDVEASVRPFLACRASPGRGVTCAAAWAASAVAREIGMIKRRLIGRASILVWRFLHTRI